MAWTTYQLSLAVLMVVTGSINTLSTKWADKLESENSAGDAQPFNHPFLQACTMFIGESLCLLVFSISHFAKKRKQSQSNELAAVVDNPISSFNPLIFFPPAMLDMLATSTMYVGLNLTYASSFQMLRGAVIIFTGLLSTAFLGRLLKAREWLGMLTVIMGLSVVGASDFIFSSGGSNNSLNSIITGDLLIVMAQIVTASQMVWEEKFVTKHNVPALQAVGWEGIFGFVTLSLLLIPMYFLRVGPPFSSNPRMVLEDALDGFTQMKNNPMIILAMSGTVISIAFFNFAGVSVTKELSATTRMVLDSVRTLVIWSVSLLLQWQQFYWPQIIGFALLVTGMGVYNNIINASLCKCRRGSDSEPLLGVNEDQSINDEEGRPSVIH
ncbi:Solute carrier family 35 member F6 [Daphnia magna]|uniref:Solute carrier family 35 member F6 n=1 Tax=Daphnia magna TaxID=35525 RepID=A0A0P5KC74_9CRUS|nr:Solute carrier family 35 member F6 [Daphnia magna]